jgi:hypothetical protein
VRRLLQRLRRRPPRRPDTTAPPTARGLGEPSATGADDAELDALRGELVRELDRLAAGAGGASGLRRS